MTMAVWIEVSLCIFLCIFRSRIGQMVTRRVLPGTILFLRA
jgi:hypothetical protein